jgi:hypothetical protein
VCSVLCNGFSVIRRTADSLLGFQNQRNFGTTVWHLVAPKLLERFVIARRDLFINFLMSVIDK